MSKIVISKSQIELAAIYRRMGFAGTPTPEQIDKLVNYVHSQRLKNPEISTMLEAEFDNQRAIMLRQFDNNPALRYNRDMRLKIENLLIDIKTRACMPISHLEHAAVA